MSNIARFLMEKITRRCYANCSEWNELHLCCVCVCKWVGNVLLSPKFAPVLCSQVDPDNEGDPHRHVVAPSGNAGPKI